MSLIDRLFGGSGPKKEGRRLGLSLQYAYTPADYQERELLLDKHPCGACGGRGSYITRDKGPLWQLGRIRYDRFALTCSCGFTNRVYVIDNDIFHRLNLEPTTAEKAVQECLLEGGLEDPLVEEAIVDAEALTHKQNIHEALRTLQVYEAQLPKNATFWYDIGWLYNTLGDYGRGIKAYELAVANRPSYASAWFNKAFGHLQLAQYEEALACTEEYLKLRPDALDGLERRDACLRHLRTQGKQKR